LVSCGQNGLIDIDSYTPVPQENIPLNCTEEDGGMICRRVPNKP